MLFSPAAGTLKDMTSSPHKTTLQDMWATRPPRLPSDQGGGGKIAGVCEGIGVRYNLDPTLVRIVFVVTSLFGGGGVLAYVFAWLIMPRWSMPLSPFEIITKNVKNPHFKKERSTGFGLFILLFILIFLDSDDHAALITSSKVISLVLLAIAWWLAYTRAPIAPEGLLTSREKMTPENSFDHSPQQDPGADPLGAMHPMDGFTDPRSTRTPPSWDPLGAAPFAWDLPAPGPAQPEYQPKPGPSTTQRVLGFLCHIIGLTFIICAIAVAASFYYLPGVRTALENSLLNAEFNSSSAATNKFILAGAAFIFGLGMLFHGIGAMVMNKMKMGIFVLVIGAVALLGGNHWFSGPVTFHVPTGPSSVTYDTADEIPETIVNSAKNMTVSLKDLEPLKEERLLTITNTAGELMILAPQNIPVTFTCDNTMGNAAGCGSYNDDGDGKRLTVVVTNTAGNVIILHTAEAQSK